jgi:putative flavoprotein involved in K+ transport
LLNAHFDKFSAHVAAEWVFLPISVDERCTICSMLQAGVRFYGHIMTTQRIHLVQPSADRGGIESIPTVIVGGGQAGLAMGYYLQQAGEQFVILDAELRIGDVWRHRWDSLKLFSFPKYASLPGWPMQLSSFPTHNEMADYLEEYAQRFELPVRSGVRATRVSRSDSGFRVETSHGVLRCDRVIIATGGYSRPVVPTFADELGPGIRQLHSSAYKNSSQLEGTVLVVGAGNSGAEIALEAVRSGHQTWLSGRHPGQVPFRLETRRAKLLVPIVMFAFRRVLNLDTPLGRKFARQAIGHGTPLVRTKQSDLEAAGVQRVGRLAGVRDGQPITEDEQVLEPETVVWCTGYRPDYSWIELPVAEEDGHPITERGVSPEAGLYFIGTEFQYAAASSTIQGLDQDARYLMRAMAKQPSGQPVSVEEPAAA